MTPRSTRIRRRILRVVGAVVLLGRAAAADPTDPPSARARFEAGVDAFERRDFSGALDAFTASYRLAPLPEVLHNIALTEQELGQWPESLATFERYLREASARPAGVPRERRALVEAAMTDLRLRVGVLRLTVTPPDSAVVVDGRPIDVRSGAAYLRPGRHEVRVEHRRFVPRRLVVNMTAGAETLLGVTLAPEPPPSLATSSTNDVPARSGHAIAQPLTIALGGVAVASLLGGAALGVAALDRRSDYRASCASVCDPQLYDAGHTLAVTADVLFGVGAAASIATVVSIAWRPAGTRVRVAPQPVMGGAGLSAAAAF